MGSVKDWKAIFVQVLKLIDGAMDTQNVCWRNTPNSLFFCNPTCMLPDSGYHYFMIDSERDSLAFCFYASDNY